LFKKNDAKKEGTTYCYEALCALLMMAYGVTLLDGSQCTVGHPGTRAWRCLSEDPAKLPVC
jgi:hypothetical protein